MKKIGLLTFHFVENLGGVLQAYALQNKLTQINKSIEFINFQPKEISAPYNFKLDIKDLRRRYNIYNSLKILMYRLINRRKLISRRTKFDHFRANYMKINPNIIESSKELEKKGNEYDGIIVGSDQIWNPDFLKKSEDAYLLEFLSDSKLKMSYAASMGVSPNKKYNLLFEDTLNEFDYISVREDSMKPYLEGLTDKEIEVVMDPTLLLDKNDWLSISTQKEVNFNYILVYDLETNSTISNLVNELSAKYNWKIISYSNSDKYKNRGATFKFEGPSEFISLVNNAEFIVTSSFHGTVFSILFNKPFYTIPHSSRGSRMIDLLHNLNLESRIWSKNSDITLEVDFKEAEEKLEILRNKSQAYIDKLPL